MNPESIKTDTNTHNRYHAPMTVLTSQSILKYHIVKGFMIKMTVMNKTPSSARQKILDAAQALIMTKGFHGVSVDQIINDAGVSKGSFFYHFSSKDELPGALLDRFIQRQGEDILHAIESQSGVENPLSKAHAVVDGLVDVFKGCSGKEPGCMMAAFSYQQVNELNDVQMISQAAVKGWNESISLLLADLCQQNSNAPSPLQLAEYLLCCLQGAFVVARINSDAGAIVRAGDTFKNHLDALFA